MFCHMCGKELSEAMAFCPSCGTKARGKDSAGAGPTPMKAAVLPAPAPQPVVAINGSKALFLLIDAVLIGLAIFVPWLNINLYYDKMSFSLLDLAKLSNEHGWVFNELPEGATFVVSVVLFSLIAVIMAVIVDMYETYADMGPTHRCYAVLAIIALIVIGVVFIVNEAIRSEAASYGSGSLEYYIGGALSNVISAGPGAWGTLACGALGAFIVRGGLGAAKA